eukprot:CAMPEP_0113526380 /NCGR_PEP_ID=MMETSP0015_2-20120614/706_1 /TAXON_ID=2838 /ORGANISM="Odontella" /LENGTH=295 /DNA_ID=CAMNT_0000424693 /DNA_START=232 /DNA_END=1119 /DNA_ORIENTATION=+ /assembly_acc=CAM_ASM_000160
MNDSPDQLSSNRNWDSAARSSSALASSFADSKNDINCSLGERVTPASKKDPLERNRAVDRNGNALPESFCCPLTMKVMKDPVVDLEGNTFERAAILDWLTINGTNPLSRKALAAKDLVPNQALRGAILHAMGPDFGGITQGKVSVSTSRSDSDFQGSSETSDESFREVIGRYLVEIGSSLGQRLCVNSQGVCAFLHGRFTVVIEVPEAVGSFFIYSPLQNISIVMNAAELKNKALELNYLQQETRGGCLSIDPINKDLIFSYTDKVRSVRGSADFRTILENFLDTASRLFREINI